ncbi:MAG: choice-of-anchor V domain-containing protein [Candidatus Eiseniibacteriota bacterium]
MKIATTFVLVLALIFICISIPPTHVHTVMANANTPPAGHTGAPSEGTCAGAGCHVGTGGTGGLVAAPATTAFQYQPGATDTIVVGLANLGSLRFGFEATALLNNGSMAGSFANLPDMNTLIQSSGGKSYISHTSNGATAPLDLADGTYWSPFPIGAGGWLFEWTAPPPGSGPVTFYVTGVAANGDELASASDTSYVYSVMLTEQGTAVTPTTWGKIKQIYR